MNDTESRDPNVPPADIASLRREYELRGLREEDALPDAIAEFAVWFDDAVRAGVREPNAMTLATASADGAPSARIVLLKGVDHGGFVFFTNYESAKGRELAENPRAALVFFWPELERQVRVVGKVSRVSAEESDEYFASRPLGARLGAWASRQSTVISGRDDLERALQETQRRFPGDVPRPAHWGGFRLAPERIEFWQGRPSRLHDRLVYVRSSPDGVWSRARLSP
jgi:pyridoxamine 5'-phosphate oxidase